MAEKVVLAYSGGLDTSVAIRWIAERYNMEVIALSIEIGAKGICLLFGRMRSTQGQ